MAWTILGLLWLGAWAFWDLNWHQILLGLGTGAILASWATEITGDRAPDWMVRSLGGTPGNSDFQRPAPRSQPSRRRTGT